MNKTSQEHLAINSRSKQLEHDLEEMKAVVKERTPDEVLASIDATLAAAAVTDVSYVVTTSCSGSTDAWPS